jgi:hypothetical protein
MGPLVLVGLDFLARLKKLLSNNSVSQLSILLHLGKIVQSHGNICVLINPPIWRRKDLERIRSRPGRVFNANVQEKKKVQKWLGVIYK